MSVRIPSSLVSLFVLLIASTPCPLLGEANERLELEITRLGKGVEGEALAERRGGDHVAGNDRFEFLGGSYREYCIVDTDEVNRTVLRTEQFRDTRCQDTTNVSLPVIDIDASTPDSCTAVPLSSFLGNLVFTADCHTSLFYCRDVGNAWAPLLVRQPRALDTLPPTGLPTMFPSTIAPLTGSPTNAMIEPSFPPLTPSPTTEPTVMTNSPTNAGSTMSPTIAPTGTTASSTPSTDALSVTSPPTLAPANEITALASVSPTDFPTLQETDGACRNRYHFFAFIMVSAFGVAFLLI